MSHGRKIELFLVNDDSNGLTTLDFSGWQGKAIAIPRLEITGCQRDDIVNPGVYFLFGRSDDDDEPFIYIGESENVKQRLIQHLADYNNGKETFYWQKAVIITGQSKELLNKASIRYLENRLFEIAKKCNRFDVKTKSTYKNTVLKEADRGELENFIDDVKIVTNVLGYNVFFTKFGSEKSTKSEILHLKKGSTEAKGQMTAEGFILFKGAVINPKTSKKSLNKNSIVRRKTLISAKVKNLRTKEDLLFTSPSAAADFVLGYSISGPQSWMDKSGKTLKEINSSYIEKKYSVKKFKLSKNKKEENIFYLNMGAVKAKGKIVSDGFTIFKGSVINAKTVKKSLRKNEVRERLTLMKTKVNEFKTIEQIKFKSPSAAADFVLGYSVSGPQSWKNSSGKTLKEVLECK
jgi:hypothetical protein